MGARVSMVGLVGRDPFGEMLIGYLQRQGIDVSQVGRVEGSSGTAQISVDRNGQNEIIVSPGANGRLTPEELTKARERLADSDVILAQHEIPEAATEWLIEFAAANRIPILLNPAPARTIKPTSLAHVSTFAPNETETEFYTGIHVDSQESARAAAECIHRMGVREVIITMGERGVLWSRNGQATFMPAYRVKAIDTTAAGDCFIGTLSALAGGHVTEDAIRGACAAAAISVTRPGAQPSMPLWAEVERFMKEAGENG